MGVYGEDSRNVFVLKLCVIGIICGLTRGVQHCFLFTSSFAFELYSRSLQKSLNHLANPLLHLRTDSAFTNQNRKPVEVLGMFPTQLDVLDNLDQNLVSTLFKGSSVTKVVFHFRSSGRPLETFWRVLSFFHCEGCMHRADDRHFRADHPAHDAASFFPYPFDAGHKVREISQFTEQLPVPLESCLQFHLISVRRFDSKHLLSVIVCLARCH